MQKDIDCFLYAYGNAAENYDCEKGPLVLKTALEKNHFDCHWHPPLTVSNRKQKKHALHDVADLCHSLAKHTQQSVLDQHFFITLGGDHSGAIGSWSGAANAISGDLGLIWVDAHMDSHTPQTSHSQNIHGMPLASLLGQGDPTLTHILSSSAKLKPENTVLIGIRSYENEEAHLLETLGVKVFYIEDVQKLGIQTVFSEALEIVTRHASHFGISIDLDAFDPIDAPGVGSRETNGLNGDAFLQHFSMISHHEKLIGMDIMEFNPELDENRQTEKLAVALCDCV